MKWIEKLRMYIICLLLNKGEKYLLWYALDDRKRKLEERFFNSYRYLYDRDYYYDDIRLLDYMKKNFNKYL